MGLNCHLQSKGFQLLSAWSKWNEIWCMYCLKSSFEKSISDVLYFDLLWCKLKFCSECPIKFVTENKN